MATSPATVRRALLLVLAGASSPAAADPANPDRVARGVELGDAKDPYAGVDMRLSFPLSPLTINPTFDYVFDDKRTLYEISVNALYYLPIPIHRVDPYVGVASTSRRSRSSSPRPGSTNNGNRLGLNLAAARASMPRSSRRYVQVAR